MDSDQAKKTEKKQKSPRSEIVELHPTKPDITEHKKAEEAVRHSKQQWENTFNAMSDWVVLIDVGGRIIRSNRAGENFTGKTLDEIIGQSCCKLVHGEDKHIPGCPLQKMLKTRQRGTAELRVPGTDRWLMVTVDPVTNSKGNIVGAVHITRDITERKKAEKAVRESEERYKYLFEQSPLGIGLATPDGRLVHVNKTMEVITGYFNEELKKINLADTYENPQDRKKLLETIERYGCAVDFPVRLKRKDGTVYDALLNVSRVHLGGQELFQTICMDITERKRAQEELKWSKEFLNKTINALDDPVFVKDEQHQWVVLNDAACEAMGRPREELIGKSDYDLSPKEEADVFWKQDDHVLETGETNLNVEEITWHGKLHTISTKKSVFTDSLTGNKYIAGTIRDITDNKRAEEALRESEERYRSLIEHIPSVSWKTDQDGNTIFISPNVEGIYGYTPDEIYNKGDELWFARVHPDDKEKVKVAFDGLFTKGEKYDVEYRIQRKDGNWIWLNDVADNISEKDDILYAYGAFSDITERKQAEEAYRSLVDHSMQGLVIFQDGRVVFANEAMAKIAGYTVEEMLAVSPEEVEAFVHPEDRGLVWSRHRDRLKGKKPPEQYEFRGIRKNGSVCWLEIHASRIEYQGKPAIQAAYMDITERKRAEEALREGEERYRTLIESSHEVILCKDRDGHYHTLNLKAAIGLGGTCIEDIEGKTDYDLLPKEQADALRKIDKEVMESGKDREVEEVVRDAQGEDRVYLSHKWPIYDSQGRINGITCFAMDITKRKRAEEELQAEKDKAQKYLDVAGVMFIAIDVEGKVALINKKGCEILGYGEKEIVGKNLFGNFLPERVRDGVRGVYEKVIKGELESVEYYENPVLTKNGDERLIAWHNTILRDGKGEAIGSLSSGEDITERKHTEEQIEKLARFPAENPNPVLRISARGTVIYGNEASLPLLKFWQCRINGSVSGCWYEFVLDALSSGQSQRTEIKCDGQTFSLVFTPVMDANYVNVYGLDITERKRAEEAVRMSHDYLERLTNSMWDAVFSVKMPERVIEWVNNSVRLIGYEPQECVGKTTEFLYHSRSEFLDFGKKLTEAIETGEDVLHVEELLRRKNGESFSAEVTTTFFREKGQLCQVTSIVRDITEHKRAETKLLDYQEQLKSLASQLTLTEEQERRRIATDMHDNITQSLAMSKLKLDLVRDSESSSSTDLVEVLNETSKNIEHIIQEVRTLTFDLSSPILYELGFEAAVAEWLTVRIQKEHGIATEFEDDEQPKPMDDDTRTVLFRDVRELLTNVVKHAQAKKVKVSIRKVGSRIHVIVEDDGRGFDPEKTTAAAAKNGVFGLFSIRERLKQLGGNIEIESAPGQGTRVNLVAPLKSES